MSRVQQWAYQFPLSSPHSLTIRILKELLLTYTESDASEGQKYAEELIKLVIADPTSYVFDDVLDLAPIKSLENSRICKVRMHYNQSWWNFLFCVRSAFEDFCVRAPFLF